MSFRILPFLLAIAGPAAAEISFNFDVRPVLSKNCIGCHGPDPEGRGGDYRLDTREGALRIKDGVAGIVPGDAEASDVYKRIISDDPKYMMPHPSHGSPLEAKEIEIIKQWINEGAKYEAHWSFVAPERPEVPETAHSSRVRNAIDGFVFAAQEEKGLAPTADATPHELARRVALDITGLPPTPEQVQAFAAEPTDENYGKLVDELLASPAYGENWAAKWLDYARYADTIGYAEDLERKIWPWRDWVIRSYNSNQPFDEFTRDQLAGDLLPNPTQEQLLATAFHRNTPSNSEGGTNDEEFRTIAVKDRASVTINTWMGLTMRCAECHTHKYDPITQKEFYEFLDYFNQSQDTDNRDDRPRHPFFPEGRDTEFAELERQLAYLHKQRLENPSPWKDINADSLATTNGAELTQQTDGTIVSRGPKPNHEDYLVTFTLKPGSYRGIKLQVLPDDASGGKTGRSNEGSFVLNQLQMHPADKPEATLEFADARGDYHGPNGPASHLIKPEIKPKNFWKIGHPLDGFAAPREAVFELAEPLSVMTPTQFTVALRFRSPWNGGLIASRFRLSTTEQDNIVAKFKKREFDPIGRKILANQTARNSPIHVPIMLERAENRRRDTHINLRGSFMALGEKVSAATPAAFPPLPEGAPKNRLGVAQWLMSADNPLTGRVTANRFWAHFFGIGIVETEEDFGLQGTLPSHPDLLDWLAVEFRENGWDRKEFIKLIVTSSAYRQSARANEEALEKDPRNRLITRGPRFRLSAENVRDQALAVAGLLSPKLYGAPVFPPNPIKEYVNAFTGGMTWNVSKGEDRYRRAIYTFLKRSQPHPLFENFDMNTREVCNLRRFRTNTPLQGFQTLNDEAFVEAAQALAGQMLKQSDDRAAQIGYGLERALMRPVIDQQVEVLTELFDENLKSYSTDAEAAQKMSGSTENAAEHAAMTVVANVILNLDGFLVK